MASILLSSGKTFTLDLISNPVSDHIGRYLKHLQHVDVPVGALDVYPYYRSKEDELLLSFIEKGEQLGVSISPENFSQEYFNELHQIYEKGYPMDHNPLWHDFHELIHMHEIISKRGDHPFFAINYREFGGPLEQPFLESYYQYGTLTAERGTVYSTWSELGKVPMVYYEDGEPNDIDRITELMKPWLVVRARFSIATEPYDFLPEADRFEKFKKWFEPHRKAWCKHWQLEHWEPEDMFKVIPIGTIPNMDGYEHEIMQGAKVLRCML